jgi:hypothetical protein
MKTKIKNNSKKEEIFTNLIVITLTLILCFIAIFASAKFAYMSFTKSDTELCTWTGGEMFEGSCTKICQYSLSDKRGMMIVASILFPIITFVFLIYLKVMLKKK